MTVVLCRITLTELTLEVTSAGRSVSCVFAAMIQTGHWASLLANANQATLTLVGTVSELTEVVRVSPL